jgi:hypothetical protein
VNTFFFTCICILHSLVSYSTLSLCVAVFVCVCVCVVRACACVKHTRKKHTTPPPSHISLSHTKSTSAQTHTHTCAPLASSVASSHSSCCCCILKYVDRAPARRRAGTAATFPKFRPCMARCDEWHEGNATPHEGNAWVGFSPRACMHGHVRRYACTKRYNDKRYSKIKLTFRDEYSKESAMSTLYACMYDRERNARIYVSARV